MVSFLLLELELQTLSNTFLSTMVVLELSSMMEMMKLML